jgi:hypothetical protein
MTKKALFFISSGVVLFLGDIHYRFMGQGEQSKKGNDITYKTQ